MSNSTRTRRQFLASTAGTTLALGVAGCVSGGSGGDPGTDDTTTDTTTETTDEEGDHHDGEGDEHDGEGDEHDGEGDEHDGEGGEHDGEGDEHDGEGGEHDGEGDEHDGEGDEHDGEGDEHDDGDDHGHDHDQRTPEEPSPSERVVMRTEGSEQHFDPHVVWVETGGTVTWVNESGQHNAVAYHPENGDRPLRMPEGATPWRTELLSEDGATVSHTFETEGVYDYYCEPHESLGMVGTVIVGDPDPHDQPALEDPQASLPDGARSELAELAEQVNDALGHGH